MDSIGCVYPTMIFPKKWPNTNFPCPFRQSCKSPFLHPNRIWMPWFPALHKLYFCTPDEAEIKIWTERGVYNAKKTVVFLTKNFLSSTECEFQASHAVDRFSRTKGINKHRVVVIVLESCKVPKYLRHFKCVYAWKYRDSPDDKLWEIYTKVTEGECSCSCRTLYIPSWFYKHQSY